MAVNFRSDDWLYVKKVLEEALTNQRAILENVEKTYKEKLVATGDIKRIKTLLNLPQMPHLPPKD